MIAGLVTGVRQIRAPLSAGAAWILGVTLLIADRILATIPGQGAYGRFTAFPEVVGRPVLAAVLAFIAWIIGEATLAATRIALDEVVGIDDPRSYAKNSIEDPVLASEIKAIDTRLKQRQEQRAGLPTDEVARLNNEIRDLEKQATELARRAREADAEVRLLAHAPEVHNMWDRAVAEYELRSAILLPSIFVLFVSLFIAPWSWWLRTLTGIAVLFAAFLWLVAIDSEAKRANALVDSAAKAGLLTSKAA